MDQVTGIGATSLILVEKDSHGFSITTYLFEGHTREPTEIELECVAKTLGAGTHVINDTHSGAKKLVLNINDKVRIVNTLDEIDEYDGDEYYEEEGEWDGDGMASYTPPDTVLKEYKGDALIADDAVYLCPPKFEEGDTKQIFIDE